MFINGNGVKKIANILTDENIPIPSIQKNLNRGVKSSVYGVWQERLNALVRKYVNLEYKNCQCFAVMATWKIEMRWRRRRSRRLRHVKC